MVFDRALRVISNILKRGKMANGESKVCILTSVHTTTDVRIFHKQAKSLAKAGYDVVLIGQHNKNETVDNVRIIALPKPKTRLHRMFGTILLIWLGLKEKAKIYHFHDPELILAGFILKLLRKKVIYDMHELVYVDLLDKHWIRSKLLKKLIPRAYLIIERLCIRIFDHLICAEDPQVAYLERVYGNIRNYTVIHNFPILSLINSVQTPETRDKGKPILIYAGGLVGVRGAREMVKAMEYIGDRADLWLFGKWASEELRNECEIMPGWKYVKYMNLVPVDKLYEHMKKADVGVAMLYPLKAVDRNLLTKTFEYMGCSLPVVMSDFPYWRDFYRECAVFAKHTNPSEIADKILYLLDNPEEARELGRRGRKMVEYEFNWEKESQKLLNIYDKL